MRRTEFLLFAALPLIVAFLHSSQAQYGSQSQMPQARNSIPDMITNCYSNFSAYTSYTKRPMHIENLIAIIRKIEDKTDQQWDIRRIARTLVHRYMYDGMQFFGDAKPEFRYRQEPEERAKSMIVKELITLQYEEILPDGILDNDEKCALHWMLSHSLNGTIRQEELYPTYPGSGSGYPGSGSGSGYPGSGSGSGYPGSGGYPGSNNGGGNPSYNGNNGYNNNNNNNGYNSNNNNNNNNGNMPSMGSNHYRGKRDVSDLPKENNTFDFSKATNDSMENDNASYEHDDYDVAENKSSAANPQPKSSEEKINDDDDDTADVDVLEIQNDSSAGTGSSKSARQITTDSKQSKRPVETGVVYTKWGGVAAGRLLSGIAAGLQPTQMSVYSGVVSASQGSIGGSQPWSSGSGIAQPGNNGNGFGSPSSGSGSGAWNGNGSPSGSGAGAWNGNGSPPGSGSGAWSGNGVPSKSMINNGGYPYPGQQPQQPYPGQQPQQPAGQRWSGRKKRQVQNLQPLDSIYAVTLSGDAGQAAILNAHNEIKSNALPSGEFNDTVCPRDFFLFEQYNGEIYKDSTTWTYLTEAEVRGGLDGFILGANIARWDPSSTLRLSDILTQYYSDKGIANEPNFRACERSSLMNSYVDGAKLKEQSRSFAYLYNNRTNVISDQKFIQNPNLFESIVSEAFDKMSSAARSFSAIGPCGPNGAGDTNDNNKNVVPKLTVYGVLDPSATVQEIDEQKRFLGQLAYELNVSPTGSRLGVVGNGASMIISPNWTDSSSTLACRILQIPSQMTTQDYTRVLMNMKTELEKVKSDELRNNYTMSNGIVILLMVQGRKPDENQIKEIVRLTREINDETYDVTVVTTSTKYSETDFGFDEDDREIRHIRLQQGQGNFSSLATEFAKGLLKNTHGALRYMQCDSSLYDQDQEHLTPQNLYLDPNSIEYYRISPHYFHRGRSMVFRFSSFNGKVRICMSRKEWYPNAQNQEESHVECQETTGNYVEVGRGETDVEFRGGHMNKPCGKHGKKSDCDPIYLSITPIEFRGPGQVGLDCSQEPCQSSNQVRVTFTHWDMRCDGVRSVLSSTVAFITLSLALINWLKST